ncbi:hypothetical protein L9G74_18750 [Shewanella sp. C32]|uniref:Uncharacterized protein n=1 Tax=Shewanella electrica TaxID=515560 RepID=A0ABT2FTH5_9GAMM|nr:hypothetical protein [Shewanella electrica]MCH1926929.1 hypothetical protein [Shewanella electrica]MCS4558481.1 hypothetical protein [Shewanella electrica]
MSKFKQLLATFWPLFMLFVPLTAMVVNQQLLVMLSDVVVGALTLCGCVACYQWIATKNVDRLPYRLATAAAMVASLLLIWANLTNELIEDSGVPFNQIIAVLLVVGLIGTTWSKQRPKGMAVTMLAMAGAMFIMTMGLAMCHADEIAHWPMMAIFCLTVVALYILASWLFERSSHLLAATTSHRQTRV